MKINIMDMMLNGRDEVVAEVGAIIGVVGGIIASGMLVEMHNEIKAELKAELKEDRLGEECMNNLMDELEAAGVDFSKGVEA